MHQQEHGAACLGRGQRVFGFPEYLASDLGDVALADGAETESWHYRSLCYRTTVSNLLSLFSDFDGNCNPHAETDEMSQLVPLYQAYAGFSTLQSSTSPTPTSPTSLLRPDYGRMFWIPILCLTSYTNISNHDQAGRSSFHHSLHLLPHDASPCKANIRPPHPSQVSFSLHVRNYAKTEASQGAQSEHLT